MTSSLQGVIDDGYLLSLDHQRHLATLVGEGTAYDAARGGRFDVNLADGTIVFSNAGSQTEPLTMRAHFLGAAAPGPGTWLWGWENVNGLPDDVIAYARHVRDFGAQAGLAELTTAQWPLTDSPRMEAVTYATIAGTICGGMAHYSLDAGRGTVVALLLDSPVLALGEPSAARAAALLPSAASAEVIVDWRRAVRSYGQMRSFAVTEDATTTTLTAPDGAAVATFDAHSRLTRVEATLTHP